MDRGEHSWSLLVLLFGAGLIGARIAYVLLYPAQAGGWSALPYVWRGGLVSYGGIFASVAAAWAWLRPVRSEDRSAWWNALVLCGLVGWGIGRIGNFLAGDSEGVASRFWSLTYGRVPIQLLETLLCLGLAAALWRNAKASYLGLSGYFSGRFLIDFWRNEQLWHGLHASQWASLLGLALVSIAYARAR